MWRRALAVPRSVAWRAEARARRSPWTREPGSAASKWRCVACLNQAAWPRPNSPPHMSSSFHVSGALSRSGSPRCRRGRSVVRWKGVASHDPAAGGALRARLLRATGRGPYHRQPTRRPARADRRSRAGGARGAGLSRRGLQRCHPAPSGAGAAARCHRSWRGGPALRACSRSVGPQICLSGAAVGGI